MPARLTALDDTSSILLDKPVMLIGRHPECDIQLESRKISRRHCCIAQVENYIAVRDLGSTNGIRINGVQIPEGRLMPGDELMIGNLRYRIDWDSAVGGASIARAPAPPPKRTNLKPAGRPDQDSIPLDQLAEPDEMISLDIPIPIRETGKPALASVEEARPLHAKDNELLPPPDAPAAGLEKSPAHEPADSSEML